MRALVWGAISAGRGGETLAALGELADAGVVGFSDDGAPIASATLMRNAIAYASVVDLLVLGWWAGDGDADWSSRMLEPLALAAADVDTPVVVSPVEATSIGAWVTSWRDRGVLFGRGIE